LADVHTRQGRTELAEALLDTAWQRNASGDDSIARMALHAARGRAELQAGDKEHALLEFGRSLEQVRQMRFYSLSADEFRVSAEFQHEAVLRSYIRTAMELSRESGEKRYAAAAFVTAEDHRQAIYFQRLIAGAPLSPEYYSTFAAYRRMLALSLREPQNPQYAQQLRELGRQISEFESRLGLEISRLELSHQKNERTDSADVLLHLQKKLSPEEAVLSFVLGPERSYLWCLTRERLTATELADEATIAKLIGEFSGWIKVNHPMLKTGSERIFRELFKGISEEVMEKPSWLIVPDGALLKLPFAALLNTHRGGFLVESHTLRVLPSAMMLTDQTGQTAKSAEFAGFGDAIYNSADPRYAGDSRADGELGRLPASARELRLSANAFQLDPDPDLNTGRQFTRDRLRSVFAKTPAVLHLAGHVVQHPKDPAQVLIATGLTHNGEQEFLAPREIMTWRGGAGLVMLSGCGSGSGSELPGLGLIGLTRSWLIAGAQTVAATYWPIEDSESGLVTRLYSELRRHGLPMTSSTVAESLRTAQLEAIREGGWRAQPSYWAGYFVVGKE
jgi:CHAT domain-containing protein